MLSNRNSNLYLKAAPTSTPSLFDKITTHAPIINQLVSYFVPQTKNQHDNKTIATESDEIKSMVEFMKLFRPNAFTALFKTKFLEAKAARVLCQYVVYSNYGKVKEMLSKNPKLVFLKSQVQDYSFYEDEKTKQRIYRESKGTPFQLALANQNVSRTGYPDDGMASLIKTYLFQASKTEEAALYEIKKQFKEQFPEKDFPEYYEEDCVKRERMLANKNANLRGLDLIENIFTLVAESKSEKPEEDAVIQAELKRFREFFKPQGVITQGLHFNMYLLVRALELYDTKLLTNYRHPKNEFIWQKVIGYIERFVSACYAQAFCQRLYKFIDRPKHKLKYDLNVYQMDHPYGDKYFPLDLDPQERLGFDYAFPETNIYHSFSPASGGIYCKAYVEQKEEGIYIANATSKPLKLGSANSQSSTITIAQILMTLDQQNHALDQKAAISLIPKRESKLVIAIELTDDEFSFFLNLRESISSDALVPSTEINNDKHRMLSNKVTEMLNFAEDNNLPKPATFGGQELYDRCIQVSYTRATFSKSKLPNDELNNFQQYAVETLNEWFTAGIISQEIFQNVLKTGNYEHPKVYTKLDDRRTKFLTEKRQTQFKAFCDKEKAKIVDCLDKDLSDRHSVFTAFVENLYSYKGGKFLVFDTPKEDVILLVQGYTKKEYLNLGLMEDIILCVTGLILVPNEDTPQPAPTLDEKAGTNPKPSP